MVIQLANRSVVQPPSVLKDVLIQVNELIFLVDLYVLYMEDEASEEGSTLILGRPFLMMAKTKSDVHVRTLSMEFEDTFVKFNIFEALKHPAKDHSIFSINAIDGLVEEYVQIGTGSANLGAETTSNNQQEAISNSRKKESQQTEAESDFEQLSLHLDRQAITVENRRRSCWMYSGGTRKQSVGHSLTFQGSTPPFACTKFYWRRMPD
ncbi:hypothetical protein CR513_37311, partial [Mucuna pruriens]